MKALTFSRFGGPEVLEYADLADPVAVPGRAVVRLHAIGLNFADVYRRRGNYHLAGAPPYVAGYEGAGIVESVHPSDVSAARPGTPRPGDRVGFADSPYANAERCLVDLDRLIPLPASVSCATAAAVLLQGLTAQYLVRDSFALRAGHHALVHAAAGGVGLLLVQMARVCGARVTALVSSDPKAAAAREAGADLVVLYGDGWIDTARATTPASRGFDVVYDSVGRTLDDSLRAARVGGAVVFYGMAGGEPPAVDPRRLMDESKTVTGGDLWNVLTSAAERRSRAAELFAAIGAGSVRPRVAATFALSDGRRAHEFLESRQAIGKVLLIP